MTHHRSHRLSLLILAGVLLAAPSWDASGKNRSVAFDPLNPGAGCEMDPNGVLHC